MPRQVIAKSEVELWQDLIQNQQDYAQSLASLDALVLDGVAAAPLPLDPRLIEEAAEKRRVAYSKYRSAMNEIAGFNRK
jgi:hypothetical protein